MDVGPGDVKDAQECYKFLRGSQGAHGCFLSFATELLICTVAVVASSISSHPLGHNYFSPSELKLCSLLLLC